MPPEGNKTTRNIIPNPWHPQPFHYPLKPGSVSSTASPPGITKPPSTTKRPDPIKTFKRKIAGVATASTVPNAIPDAIPNSPNPSPITPTVCASSITLSPPQTPATPTRTDRRTREDRRLWKLLKIDTLRDIREAQMLAERLEEERAAAEARRDGAEVELEKAGSEWGKEAARRAWVQAGGEVERGERERDRARVRVGRLERSLGEFGGIEGLMAK